MKKNHIIFGRTMRKYLLALIASLMATVVQSQTMTAQQEREFYQKVYELMDEYASVAAVSDEDDEWRFRELFVKRNIQIANDLMSLSREDSLSLDDYIQKLQEAKSVKVTVRNIKKASRVEEREDAWLLDVTFEKSIEYSTCSTLFNSGNYFGQPYRLKATIALNKKSEQCHIDRLVVDESSKSMKFPENFRVLVRADESESKRNYKRDEKLTINGNKVKWNDFGQVILHDGDVIKYEGSTIKERLIGSNDCGGRKIHANYNDKSFRIRANIGFSISDFNRLVDAEDDLNVTKAGEMGYGLDFGYIFPTTRKFYTGIFTGIGMSSNNLTLEMNPTGSATVIKGCQEDEDKDTYDRYYVMSGNGINQKMEATDITIPLYVDFEFRFSRHLSVYADLGLKLQTSTGKWTAHTDGYETYGIYSLYNNLKIDGSVYLNDFGIKPPHDLEVDEEGMTTSMSVNALMGVGLRLNLGSSFALEAGVQYTIGGKSWKMEDDMKEKSVFNYTLAEGDKVNLLRQASGINHSALRMTVGLVYKF